LFFTFLLRLAILSAVLLCATPAAAEPLNPSEVANALSKAFERSAEAITPSLVSIIVKSKSSPKSDPKSSPKSTPVPQTPLQPKPDVFANSGQGTGVVIDERGYILTNHHVIENGEQFSVRFHDNRTRKAKIVGKDVKADLALLKISGDYEPAAIGDSDSLHTGQWVIAAGTPFGLANSYTAGIISAKGRVLISGMPNFDFIQTDAAVNMGNSGGPLINLEGEVIGINTSIYSRSGGSLGIGFAIPINRAMAAIKPMIKE